MLTSLLPEVTVRAGKYNLSYTTVTCCQTIFNPEAVSQRLKNVMPSLPVHRRRNRVSFRSEIRTYLEILCQSTG